MHVSSKDCASIVDVDVYEASGCACVGSCNLYVQMSELIVRQVTRTVHIE